MSINDCFFDNITSECQAYWLGFLSADAGITIPSPKSRGYHIQINLAGRDRNHLEKFLIDIDSDHSIYDTHSNFGTSVSRLDIGSKRLVNALIDLGVTPKKSHSIVPWTGPNELLRHYWRGFFDGDGSISKCTIKKENRSSYQAWKVSFNGNKKIVNGFRNFIVSTGGKAGSFAKHYSIYKVSWGGVLPAKMAAKPLYEQATIALDRKQNIAEELLAYETERTKVGSVRANKFEL